MNDSSRNLTRRSMDIRWNLGAGFEVTLSSLPCLNHPPTKLRFSKSLPPSRTKQIQSMLSTALQLDNSPIKENKENKENDEKENHPTKQHVVQVMKTMLAPPMYREADDRSSGSF